MAILDLIDITQQFKDGYSLKAVNLCVDQGDVFALIGPTGAGKTTLIRIIDLLDWPMSGQIIFGGTDVTRSKRERLKARRRMAYVQQRPTVFDMNVYDNVALGLKWRRVPRSIIRGRVEHALELVGLADYQKRNARTLSGGETQRVAIARALVTGPELLLLDEPTANLDPAATHAIEELIDSIKKSGTKIVMSTHDLGQARRLADNVLFLYRGRLLENAKAEQFFEKPENDLAQAFLKGELLWWHRRELKPPSEFKHPEKP